MKLKRMFLGVSPLSKKVNCGLSTIDNEKGTVLMHGKKHDLTEDFKRCLVQYVSESVDIEVDGMRFHLTCEQID